MHTPTYNLRYQPGASAGLTVAGDSSAYYRDAAVFADRVTAELRRQAGGIAGRYRDHLAATNAEALREPEEYAFELLILGTLWRIYSGDASALEPVPQRLLQGLVELRRMGGPLKPGIDLVRGVLSTIFLSPDLYDHLFELATEPRHLETLLSWLEATGEFHEECLRLRGWQRWLAGIEAEAAVDALASALSLAAWFEAESLEALGAYTEGVERYLKERRPERYWQEDVIFCGRRRVEYHLNMVGAEIMNRAMRRAFKAAARKLVVLPACMRLLKPDDCRAVERDGRLVCAACHPGCQVATLSRAGAAGGFAVAMVAHESSLSATRDEGSFLAPDMGVVGVACVLNLISGGWMLRRRGIPAQCVLLDWCGCSRHWSAAGVPTAIDLGRLAAVLG